MTGRPTRPPQNRRLLYHSILYIFYIIFTILFLDGQDLRATTKMG
jgi:hypothetical protein